MRISTTATITGRKGAGALFLPFYEKGEPAFKGAGLSPLYKAALDSKDFTGKEDEVLLLYPGKGKEKRVVLIGLGKKKGLIHEKVRKGYAAALVKVKSRADSINIVFPEGYADAALEGAVLASYTFDCHKKSKDKTPKKCILVGGDKKIAKRGELLGQAVFFARDLVMGDADFVTPAHLIEKAKEIAAMDARAKMTSFNRSQIEKKGMGLLAAVARSSAVEPALICLEYKGDPKSKDLTALVGKGITFDTGGLLLKPKGGMETMRDDMGGAAAVLGAMHAAVSLSLPINLVCVVASTENAIAADSYKPGDVYTGYSGLTVEINDTDAEGRLVLADALAYTEETYKPSRMIDVATLTGGVIVALGDEVTGLMSTDDTLSKRLVQAGEKTYERLWRLPLFDEYKALLKSTRADLKNSGVRKASAIQGGTFLKHFVKKTPWAHLDIGGTVFHPPRPVYNPVEATGVGVRLLTTFFEDLCGR